MKASYHCCSNTNSASVTNAAGFQFLHKLVAKDCKNHHSQYTAKSHILSAAVFHSHCAHLNHTCIHLRNGLVHQNDISHCHCWDTKSILSAIQLMKSRAYAVVNSASESGTFQLSLNFHNLHIHTASANIQDNIVNSSKRIIKKSSFSRCMGFH